MGKKIGEFWGNGPKWARILFWIFLGLSTALIIASWFVPPVGEINSSVLAAVGEVMGFASLGVGFECIFEGMNVTLKKGNTTISVARDADCTCETKTKGK